MSVSSDPSSGLHLPQPSSGESYTGPYEQPGSGTPLPTNQNIAPAQQFQVTTPPPIQQPMPVDHHAQVTAQNDQTDELDKEWINKAKLIVEQTKHDPYIQSREIGRAKADYLRIRFNKHIKLSPDQTL